ncbi:MAG: ABC transporter ATP-binding protein [Treponema sp.]|nr:ABC transporter ATP-binding protein [Treponema sp.]
MKTHIIRPILGKLRRLLTRKHKIYLLVLLVLTVLLSLIETAGVSIIMPFISVASAPATLDSGVYKTVYDFFNFESKNRFVITFGVGIVVFYMFRAAYNLFYTYTLNRFSLGMFRHFATTLFKTFLGIPYKVFVQRNSSELMQIINQESHYVSQLLLNLLQIFSELFTVVLLYGFMVVVNWQMTLVLTGILLIAVYFILHILVRKSKEQGVKRAGAYQMLNRIVGETFGNYKFIKLRGNEKELFNDYSKTSQIAARAQIISSTLNMLPRNLLEGIGFSLLVLAVVFIVWYYKSPENVIPIISMYALALYRILPSINKMLGNVNQITYHLRSLDLVYDNTHQTTEHDGNEPLAFEETIRVENLCFKYLIGGDVLNNISLEIHKGEKIAITGESGGGKSTLVDLIIGIHKPSSGVIYIDGAAVTSENIRSWRSKIGYIPQGIYLFDGTVGENVAFGSTHDEARIIQVLRMANIWDFLAQRDGVQTRVGEGGIQLSGGQKQRIGIARALYRDPEVLVLDEATSALDNDTEARIMDEIYDISANKTLIVIAHRLSTVERCDRRIQIENGEVVKN